MARKKKTEQEIQEVKIEKVKEEVKEEKVEKTTQKIGKVYNSIVAN